MREEKRSRAAEHQHAAALADRRLQRRRSSRSEDRNQRNQTPAKAVAGVPAARRAALLRCLQNLPDRLTIVVGQRAGAARFIDRFEHRTIGARAGVELTDRKSPVSQRNCRWRDFAVDRTAIRLCTGFADVRAWMAESATSVGSLTFLGLFAMFSPSPLANTRVRVGQPADVPRKLEAGIVPQMRS